jgi:hypothetical protein
MGGAHVRLDEQPRTALAKLAEEQVGHAHVAGELVAVGLEQGGAQRRVLARQRLGLAARWAQERAVVERQVRPAQAGRRVGVLDLRSDRVPASQLERAEQRPRVARLRVAVGLTHDRDRRARGE